MAKRLSDDGTHLVFGSTTQLEPAANDGSVTIYSRDLEAGATEVVSKKPDGSGTMTGSGIAALDVSADGSRVLVARLTGSDGKGNDLYHLYMHVAGADRTIDLMPGSSNGGIYAGMSSNGGLVYFTSRDPLPGEADSGADLYQAEVGPASATVTRLSDGSSAGDTDACAPVSGWNAASGGPDCGVLAIAGGAGAASGGGAFFLSPEDLDGEGELNQPNLYYTGGGAPEHVATLEPGNPVVVHALTQAATKSWGDFQVSFDAAKAVFASRLDLVPGADNGGHSTVYQYLTEPGSLGCVSCSPTGARAEADSTLASIGPSVTNAGTVFFDSGEALAPRDLNGKVDAYQWNGGVPQLVSPGNSPYDTRLLGVSADGVDAFFFTRDNLALQDLNGRTMKIYDARSEGGFFVIPARLPCSASDECHGPSSVPAPPPNIGTFDGTGGQAKREKPVRCKGKKVRKHGKCVPRKRPTKKSGKGRGR